MNILGKIIAAFLFTIICISSFAQENFIEGYIITNEGDTLTGFIDYRNWEMNPEKIEFKKKIDENESIYRPFEIMSFHVSDEVYLSAFVETENSPGNKNRLNTNPDFIITSDTAFLQVLIDGEKSLYYLNKKGKDNFYFLYENKIELLKHKKYLVNAGNSVAREENNFYKNQLTFYLNECKSIHSKIERTTYTKAGLVNIFNDYYACTKKDQSHKKEIETVQFEFGILAGLSATTLNFDSDGPFNYLINTDFGISYNLTGGFGINIVLPRNNKKWSINNEFLYSLYKMNGTYRQEYTSNVYTDYNIDFGESYIKVNNMLRYSFPLNNFRIFINGGISNGISISETNFVREERNQLGDVTIYEYKALERTRKHEMAFFAGFGLKYNRFSLETRYERGNGMSLYNSLLSETARYYVIIGFLFNSPK